MRKINFFLILVISFILCGCSNNENAKSITISSPINNHISSVDDFRFDNIWIDVEDKNGNFMQYIVTEDMISSVDRLKLNSPGTHNIKITYKGCSTSVNITLYDELNNEEIYCYSNKIYLASNIYQIKAPEKDGYYFINWDVIKKDNINYLYANWSTSKTYKVSFYYGDILIKEEYVKKGEAATPPIMQSFDNYVFSHWDKSFSNVQSDIRINAVYVKDYYEVVFYDFDDNIIKRELVKKGESVIPPILEHPQFVGWDKEFSFITESINVKPVFINSKKTYEIRFYENYSTNFLYKTYISYGGSVEYIGKDGYKVLGFSDSLNNITKDMSIIVYTEPEMKDYYINNEYAFSIPFDDKHPGLPNDSMCSWKKNETIENRYDLINPNYDTFICLLKYSYSILDNGIRKKIITNNIFFKRVNDLKNELLHGDLISDDYIWYYDYDLTNRIEDLSKIKINIVKNPVTYLFGVPVVYA